jgi:serine/threonine protein kinase
MARLHALGIIHRDLKSLNVLLDAALLPRLGDFGIARFAAECDTVTMRVGTPNWMAPELFGGAGYGARVDVYAFGMLLYELASDRVPFDGVERAAVQRAVVAGARPQLPAGVPAPLAALIRRCWDADPRRRPDFAAVYAAFAGGAVAWPGADPAAVAELRERLRADAPQDPARADTGDPRAPAGGGRVRAESPPLGGAGGACFAAEQAWAPERAGVLRRTIADLRSRKAAELFVGRRLYRKLPFGSQKLRSRCFDILMQLFMRKIALDDRFAIFFRGIVEHDPAKALALLAWYSAQFSERENPLVLLEVLLSEQRTFLRAHLGRELLATLFYLLCAYDEYRAASLDQCQQLFCECLKNPDPAVVEDALSALSRIGSGQLDVDCKMLASFLADRNLSGPALVFLLNCRQIAIDSSLIPTLFSLAQSDERAVLVLISHARSLAIASLLWMDRAWLATPLPTWEHTLRLFLMIASHTSLRAVVADAVEVSLLIRQLCRTEDPAVLTWIAGLVAGVTVSQTFLDNLTSQRTLRSFFAKVKEFDDSQANAAALTVLEHLAPVGYAPEYLVVLDLAIAALAEGNDQIVALFVSLSQYRQCGNRFRSSPVEDFFQACMIRGVYVAEASKFLENIMDHR